MWKVAVEPQPSVTRLVGAWVSGHIPLAPGSAVLLVGNTPMPERAASAPIFDPDLAWRGVMAEQQRLHRLHSQTPNKAGQARAPIQWPRLPAKLDVNNLPENPLGASTEAGVSETLAVARWVQHLADAWTAIETIRLGREHLTGSESHPRPLPGVSEPASSPAEPCGTN